MIKPSLEETIKEMMNRHLCCEESITFSQEVSEGVLIPMNAQLREKNGMWLVKNYEQFKKEFESSCLRDLKDVFKQAMNINPYALNPFPRFNQESRINEVKILSFDTIKQYDIYLDKCNEILKRADNPNDLNQSHGGIDWFHISGQVSDLVTFDCPLGRFVGGSLTYTISVKNSGNYDSGWNYYINHGLETVGKK